MRMNLVVLLLFSSIFAYAQNSGSLRGRATDERSGEGLPAANILLKGTSIGSAGDPSGYFHLHNIPPGTYTLIASMIGHLQKEVEGITIVAGETTTVNVQLRDETVQMGEIVVYGASMKQERLTEAPAAVSVLEAGQIQLQSGSGQVARLLETEPGVDIAQSGINDFNVNTRGFNSSLNRRLLVLQDGRDLAIAFLGAQEWNGLSVPVEDLGRIELVRGPSSALYGANAFNGVINIQTPSPRDIQGMKLTLAAGDLNSFRGDVRYAASSGKFSYKINAGRFQSKTWSVSRKNLTFEYPGMNILNNEEIDLIPDDVASTYGSGRVDYHAVGGSTSTLEAGVTQVENEVFVTGIGRVQVPKALKPWARASYSSPSFFAQVWGSARDSKDPQISLSSGLPLIERSFISQAEVQYRRKLLRERLFFIAGASLRSQSIDTEGTLMEESRNDNAAGIYGQVEYQVSTTIKTVGALRWDRSTLHEKQISPKLALVWSPSFNHSLRVTVNQAFQSPNLSELFLHILRTATNPYTGLQSNVAYFGNRNLTVERITGYEVGYKGILGESFFVTLDGYYNQLENFITDLAPGVNPQYPEPTVLPGDTVSRAVWSYNNAGKVDEQGVELGMNYYVSDSWTIDANYAFFDFKILEKSASDILLPNAPKHKINGGLTYRGIKDLEVAVSAKYVPSFDWAAGVYQGRILAYTLVNLSAQYHISPRLKFGTNITNLLDRQHYQIFGGSFIRRRAIGTLTLTL